MSTYDHLCCFRKVLIENLVYRCIHGKDILPVTSLTKKCLLDNIYLWRNIFLICKNHTILELMYHFTSF